MLSPTAFRNLIDCYLNRPRYYQTKYVTSIHIPAIRVFSTQILELCLFEAGKQGTSKINFELVFLLNGEKTLDCAEANRLHDMTYGNHLADCAHGFVTISNLMVLPNTKCYPITSSILLQSLLGLSSSALPPLLRLISCCDTRRIN